MAKSMRQLLILPGACHSLGGTLVTLALLLKVLNRWGASDRVRVLVLAGSLMEEYLWKAGQADFIESIPADSREQFYQKALRWIRRQPSSYPLLLDNCVTRATIPALLREVTYLRWQRRSIYHFFHDSALSHNPLGFWVRKAMFTGLKPVALCNSNFTAQQVRQYVPNVRGILYQPNDWEIFNPDRVLLPPEPLRPILAKGQRILLTPSRITRAHHINDKNLRMLIPIVAHLRNLGHPYHAVIVGEDRSRDQYNTQVLHELAASAGVSDVFSILPASFAIADYYRYASAVVALAPREPFGRVVIEAIASGAPVIGSNTGGIGEILGQCAPEWAVSAEDPVAAAEAILRLFEGGETAQQLATAQQWVKTHCNIEEYAKELLHLTGIELDTEIKVA
jgi:glycosyltransferase involved in cell wall biosynthesis